MFIFLLIFCLSQEIVIYHTNDILGGFSKTEATFMNPDFPPPLGRGASLSTLISNAREKDPDVLLLDAGNFMPAVILPEDVDWEMYASLMNYLSYDAGAVGISDLSYGTDIIDSLAKVCDFPLLCANLKGKENYIKPYCIIERKGVKIGLFGLMTERASFMLPRKYRNEIDISLEVESAKNTVDELKEKGADIIIALTSIGFEQDKRLAREIYGIDIIIGGHTGWALKTPYEDATTHTLIVRLYSNLSSVGKFSLKIDPTTNKIAGYDYEVLTLLEDEFLPDPNFPEIELDAD